MMEQQGPANAQQPDRLGQLDRRMSGVEGQLRDVSKQISVLTWAMGLGFTMVLVVVGWMWSSVTSDIGALRGEMGGATARRRQLATILSARTAA
jgi:hypothetical protein